jgi:hypothetical protein
MADQRGNLDRTKHTPEVQVGDTVAYSRQFLKNTGQYTGDAPFARGKVTGLTPLGQLLLAQVLWDREDLPNKVNVKNLSRVKDAVVMELD